MMAMFLDSFPFLSSYVNIFLSVIAWGKLKSYKSCGTSSLGEWEALWVNIKIFGQGRNIQWQIFVLVVTLLLGIGVHPRQKGLFIRWTWFIAYIVLVATSVIIFVLFGYTCMQGALYLSSDLFTSVTFWCLYTHLNMGLFGPCGQTMCAVQFIWSSVFVFFLGFINTDLFCFYSFLFGIQKR